MKKILLLFCLCVMTAVSYSQSEEENKGLLPNGIRIGWQSSDLLHEDFESEGTLDRYYIGAVRKFVVAPIVRIETGLEFMIAGAKFENDSERALSYIGIPAQGLVSIGPFIAQGGVIANFKVSDKLKVDGNEVDIPDDDKANTFDFAGNLGAGFSIAMFTLEARHYWGITEVVDGWHNDYWQFGVKFNFP